ncbi:MAG: efflux RND transporter permease subunit [Methylophagaceae bacterium]
MIEWFARNPVAANILMFAIVIAGLTSAFNSVPVETFPSFERNTVTISTSFRGATPKTAEEGITLRVEEAIADIEGIKEISSRSSEGNSTVNAEVADGYDRRDILDDIKVRVDALNTLPKDAEKPVVSLNVRNPTVIYVAISGHVDTKTLRKTATRFREGLLTKSQISNVQMQGVANYEMNIEISPQTLDNYNISLLEIGEAISQGASDISAGNVQTPDGDILIRSDGQAYTGSEFANIPVIANPQGSPVRLGQIAIIDDGFEDKLLVTTFNDEPAVMLEVRRVGEQSAIKVAEQTRNYMQEFSNSLPTDVKISYWDDDSIYLKTRIGAVLNSALYGGILVMLLLSLFLRPAVAFWVFIGVPVSFMGAFLFMPLVGGSFNIISLFAFIMVLGIVVDDAIVTGENIYSKIRDGEDALTASIIGTKEIAVPVTFGILTTVVAILPLNFLGSNTLAFIGQQMPMVIIPVMLMSLIESKLVLPSHLSHIKLRNDPSKISRIGLIQQNISHGLERFVKIHYQPFLNRCLNDKTITLTALIAVASLIMSWAIFGHLKLSLFPSVESESVKVYLTMPESSGFETTDKHINAIASHFETLQDKYRDPETGESLILNILATSGSSAGTIKPNVGSVQAELQIAEDRVFHKGTTEIAREVKNLIGDIPGALKLTVRSDVFRTQAPINVELSGSNLERMSEVVLLLREKFKEYPSIFDIQDNYSGGKEELSIKLKPRASSLNLSLNDIAQQVRHAVFGYQAQRIQRGRDELRVMVRYPLEYRSSIDDLYRLPIQVKNSNEEVLLSEVAEITPSESPSALYRLDRNSILNVTADIDKELGNIPIILNDLNHFLIDIQQTYPEVNYKFDGEAEEQEETNSRLIIGLLIVLTAIYALLAIPLKSYGQPLIVMSIIPFSVVAAILGHIITGQNLSSLSFFGMLALVGVVVNDSLVLVDYINKKREQGVELMQAVKSAGAARFRPVLLTSLTTFAGVIPLLLDQGQQAIFLKPMVTSLGFGILFATVMTLIIVPVNYLAARKFKYAVIRIWDRWLKYWNQEEKQLGAIK